MTPAATIGPENEALVARLFPPFPPGIEWGLERTRRILSTVGDPHLAYPVLHVGGTNGKGSVAATLASILRASGLRTGLYTSPHLRSFAERIQIDGRPAGEGVLTSAASSLRPALEAEGCTFFEAATVLAFTAFRDASVDVAVVEVGLGGRLDSTNVVEPVVTGITNVAMDHAEYLGDSLQAIAREKAGILKAGVPAVTAELDPDSLEVFREEARRVGAPLAAIGEGDVEVLDLGADHTTLRVRTGEWGELELRTPLPGAHQGRNIALAVWMLERVPEGLRPGVEALRAGTEATVWPGRVQVVPRDGTTWIFDVAHNVAGVQALAATLARLSIPRPVVLLVGILGDKDWPAMLPALFDFSDRVVLTQPPTAPTGRRWDPGRASMAVGSSTPQEILLDFGEALERARALAGEGTVVVTGSVHTVGDALEVLDLEPFPST